MAKSVGNSDSIYNFRVILSGENRKAVCEVEVCVGEKDCYAIFKRSKPRSVATKGSTKGFQ